MTFGQTWLKLTHANGFSMEFNALDALKEVDKHTGPDIKVAPAATWSKGCGKATLSNR